MKLLFLRRLQNLLVETVRLTVHLKKGRPRKQTFDSYQQAHSLREDIEAKLNPNP